jgi:tRNA nucleotidyltransferase/poly(A) polymerase
VTGPALERQLSSAAPVRAVREALAPTGIAAWLVGGVVRDALLERPLVDVDLAVDGDVEQAARAIAKAIRGPVFSLSDQFGAWRVLDAERGISCDVSPLQGDTIEADLAKRDFTINAIALPLGGGELIDPHDGLEDVQAGVLRVLGAQAYADDPLRTLRLVRLAAELEMQPDRETERLTEQAAPRLDEPSGERVFTELRRLLVAPAALEGLELARRLGILAVVVPELGELEGVEQNRYHHLDAYGHTVEVLREQIALLETDRLDELFGEQASALRAVFDEPLADGLTRGEALRLGALFHDVAKPQTQRVEDGVVLGFPGHDVAGDEIVRDVFRRLKSSERLRSLVGALARHHLRLGFLVRERPLDRTTVYRYLSRCDPVGIDVTVLSCADRLATRGRKADDAIALHLELAAEIVGPALEWHVQGPPKPPLRGDELAAELGIEPGPRLGMLLAQLSEAVYAGTVTTREEAVTLARRLEAE